MLRIVASAILGARNGYIVDQDSINLEKFAKLTTQLHYELVSIGDAKKYLYDDSMVTPLLHQISSVL